MSRRKIEMTVITPDYIDELKAQAVAGDPDAKDVLRGIDDFNESIDLQVCGLCKLGFSDDNPISSYLIASHGVDLAICLKCLEKDLEENSMPLQ
jgi:hypothetical protein